MKRFVFLLALGVAVVPLAQAQNCKDPWVTAALRSVGRGYGDSGNSGLCNINRYHAGHWNSQNELNTLVRHSFDCPDPWLGEIYFEMGYGHPSADQCNTSHYNHGQWSSYEDLRRYVSAYINTPQPQPQPRPQPRMVQFSGSDIVNNDGGFCISAAGDHLVMRRCDGSPNQQVTVDGHLRINGMCAQPDSPDMGKEIHLKPCSNSDIQNFAWWTHGEGNGQCTSARPCIGHRSGYVLAAAGSYIGERPLCLWNQPWRSDAHWKMGSHASVPTGVPVVFPSWVREVRVDGRPGVSLVSNGIISQDAASVISHDGGTVVSNDGGSVIASGGGNVIASGAGNLVATGGGN